MARYACDPWSNSFKLEAIILVCYMKSEVHLRGGARTSGRIPFRYEEVEICEMISPLSLVNKGQKYIRHFLKRFK